jgi:hypothetical protein
MPNIKMVSEKDYTQVTLQVVSFGAHFQKIYNMALRFCKTMIYSSWKMVRPARNSTRKRPRRSFRAH